MQGTTTTAPRQPMTTTTTGPCHAWAWGASECACDRMTAAGKACGRKRLPNGANHGPYELWSAEIDTAQALQALSLTHEQAQKAPIA